MEPGFCDRDGKPIDLTAVVIESERIILQPIQPRFAEDIFKTFDSEITRYMVPKSPTRIEDTEEFITGALQGITAGNNLQLVILNKATGDFLGCCGLHATDDIHHPELGIWIKRQAQGKGYGKETITTLKKWAEINVDYEYLVYPVDRRNIPSRKIPEALSGKIYEERTVSKRDGGTLDLVVYRIYPPDQ